MSAKAWLWLTLSLAVLAGAIAVLASPTARKEMRWEMGTMAHPPSLESVGLQR